MHQALKLITFLLLIALCASPLPVSAEENPFPNSIQVDPSKEADADYVVLTPRASYNPIRITSLVLRGGQLVAGENATWTLSATGGMAPYSYTFALYYQPLSSTDQNFSFVRGSIKADLSVPEYSFVIPSEGRYVLQIIIWDATNRYDLCLNVQTVTRETVSSALQNKINSIVASVTQPSMSPRDKALALHNWLCRNATYDNTHTLYQAGGVLLQGRGTCQSFSLAYQMLLAKVGIESMLIRGLQRSNNEFHSWNLVRLDGQWVHVDVTWDAPNDSTGYFCVSTEVIERDHIITDPIVILNTPSPTITPTPTSTPKPSPTPTPTPTSGNPSVGQVATGSFKTFTELKSLINELPSGEVRFKFAYTQKEDIADTVLDWLKTNSAALSLKSWSTIQEYGYTAYVLGTRSTPDTCFKIPKNIQKIEAYAFAGNGQFTGLRFDANSRCTAIEDYAFKNCTALNEVHIPASITSFGVGIFYGCSTSKLKIYVAAGNSTAVSYFTSLGFTVKTE